MLLIKRSFRAQLFLGYSIVALVFFCLPAFGLVLFGAGSPTISMASTSMLMLGILLALLLAHTTVVRLIRSLDTFSAAQQALQQGEFSQINVTALPDELVALGKSYNLMTDRLEARHRELYNQLRRTALLTRLSIELRESSEPNEIIGYTLSVIAANTDSEHGSIILSGPDGSLDVASSMSKGHCTPMSPERARQVIERGLGGWVLRNNRTVVIGDITRDSRWLHFGSTQATGSAIVLPLTHGKTTLGVLTIENAQHDHFTSNDLLLLEGVAAQAGVALGAALRQAEERRSREQALMLFAMSQVLTTQRSATELAAELLEKGEQVFSATRVDLYLSERENSGLQLFATHPAATANDYEFQRSVDVAAQAWKRREVVTEIVPLFASDASNRASESIGIAYVAMPLLHNGTMIGVFVAVRRVRGTAVFPARLWSMLTIFTNVAAAAFANVQLIGQLEHRAEELTALVDERTVQLQHSRDLLRIVFDHLPDGLLLIAPDQQILTANSAFCHTILGMRPREVVGQTVAALKAQLHKSTALMLEERQNERGVFQVLCTDSVGQQRWYEIDRYIIEDSGEQVIERWRDVTRQEELQRQLFLHEQLSSMGRLAASVVHEVGNPLQGVRNCIDLCREDSTILPETSEYLTLATSELERISSLLIRWRDLYRPPQDSWEPVDLCQLLGAMQQITARQMQSVGIRVTLDACPNLPLIHGQMDALRQVCLNLLLNAQEAMPKSGAITIRTASDPKRRMSSFSITDTGVGMSQAQLSRITQPFQSSNSQKPGLGLYLCHTIVEQHRGELKIDSVVGSGTTVTVWLPWSETAIP